MDLLVAFRIRGLALSALSALSAQYYFHEKRDALSRAIQSHGLCSPDEPQQLVRILQ